MHKSFEIEMKYLNFLKIHIFQIAKMYTMKTTIKLLFSFLFLALVSCKNTKTATEKSGYQGQGPTPLVSTKTKPVQKQWKGVWAFQDSTVYFSNQFDGARLNGVVHDSLDHYTIWITAENTPINPSPWYGFKVWSKSPKEIILKLTYQDSRSRYYPKISRDGLHFKSLDSTRFKSIHPGEGEFGLKAAPESVELTLLIDENPTWVTAQELYSSKRVAQWIDFAKIIYFKSYHWKKSRRSFFKIDGN